VNVARDNCNQGREVQAIADSTQAMFVRPFIARAITRISPTINGNRNVYRAQRRWLRIARLQRNDNEIEIVCNDRSAIDVQWICIDLHLICIWFAIDQQPVYSSICIWFRVARNCFQPRRGGADRC
jgi:hypothetical protein